VVKEAIKRLENGKWHVYSESGKHMGGPYSSEQEANHRLQQIEYFKHVKKAAATYPIARLISNTMNNDLYSKGLVGRANTANSVLTGAEKVLIENAHLHNKDSKTYPIEQLRTNPIYRGLEFGTLAALGQRLRKVEYPNLLQRYINEKPTLDEAARGAGRWTGLEHAATPENIEKLRSLTAPQMRKNVAIAGLLGLGLSAAHRLAYPYAARGKAELAKTSPDAYIRQKLHGDLSLSKRAEGPPLALADDALYWGSKLLNDTTSPTTKKPIIKSKDKTKEEIKAIEKQGTVQTLAHDAKQFAAAVVKHPIATGMHVKYHAERLADKVAPGALQFVRDSAYQPMLGTSDVALASQAVYHTARHVGRGARFVATKTQQRTQPILTRAKNEIANAWQQAKEGPK
jgi:hypothetical protein